MSETYQLNCRRLKVIQKLDYSICIKLPRLQNSVNDINLDIFQLFKATNKLSAEVNNWLDLSKPTKSQ